MLYRGQTCYYIIIKWPGNSLQSQESFQIGGGREYHEVNEEELKLVTPYIGAQNLLNQEPLEQRVNFTWLMIVSSSMNIFRELHS